MKVVISIILTSLVVSGWWYFGVNGLPEEGPLVLIMILTMFGTIADIFIFLNAMFNEWI